MGIKANRATFNYESVYNKSRIAADRLSKGVSFLLNKNKVDLVSGTAKIIGRSKQLSPQGDSFDIDWKLSLFDLQS